MAFFVGQRVKCKDIAAAPGLAAEDAPTGLEYGRVYTIAAVGQRNNHPPFSHLPCVLLNETGNYKYWEGRFRVAEDISDLQSIVTEVMNGKPRKIEDDQFDAPRKVPVGKIHTPFGNLSPVEYARRYLQPYPGQRVVK